MKKIIYIEVLSTLILTACSEDEAASKEEAPASEQLGWVGLHCGTIHNSQRNV
ncbi:hypothetical protein ACQKOF_22595 [Lysinibacillus sp. NPDC093190]|uniref:hypothetical protein n=1 Tax=Lysinibacillus sp. NPDC093190 TaxID=3390575 RepID=UPI003D02A731